MATDFWHRTSFSIDFTKDKAVFNFFTGTTTVTDTTTHTETDRRTTLPSIPDRTTDLRTIVAPTTNTPDLTRGVPITTRVPTRRETEETTITEVAFEIILLKVATTRTAIGIVI